MEKKSLTKEYIISPSLFKNDQIKHLLPEGKAKLYSLKIPTGEFKQITIIGIAFTFAGQTMNDLLKLLFTFSESKRNILFVGERGTGKEFIANTYAGFCQRDKNPINCSGLSENASISKLFGHVKGAYTGATGNRKGLFEKASDKIILLDELGAASPDFQAQLLRVLETGDYQPLGSDTVKKAKNVLVCAATSDQDSVRADLRDRFVSLYIPPLRARAGDIPEIFKNLWEDVDIYKPTYISESALTLLKNHTWPDNIRGLKKVLQTACDLTRMHISETIRKEDLPALCDDCRDDSKHIKISELQAEGSPLPMTTFFKPFKQLEEGEKFPMSPKEYRAAFYKHFKNISPTELHKKYPDTSRATFQSALKR